MTKDKTCVCVKAKTMNSTLISFSGLPNLLYKMHAEEHATRTAYRYIYICIIYVDMKLNKMCGCADLWAHSLLTHRDRVDDGTNGGKCERIILF